MGWYTDGLLLQMGPSSPQGSTHLGSGIQDWTGAEKEKPLGQQVSFDSSPSHFQ